MENSILLNSVQMAEFAARGCLRFDGLIDESLNVQGCLPDSLSCENSLNPDINLTSNKKIIEAPMFKSDGSTRMFGDDLIFWYASLSSGARLEIKFTLNRYTGRLREYHKHYEYGDTENNYWMDLIYDCSISKKLL